jgi:hypothetical protein
LKNFDSRYLTATACAAATGGFAQLLETTHAIFNRITDVGISYCIANTNEHKTFLYFDEIILNANENDCQLRLEASVTGGE